MTEPVLQVADGLDLDVAPPQVRARSPQGGEAVELHGEPVAAVAAALVAAPATTSELAARFRDRFPAPVLLRAVAGLQAAGVVVVGPTGAAEPPGPVPVALAGDRAAPGVAAFAGLLAAAGAVVVAPTGSGAGTEAGTGALTVVPGADHRDLLPDDADDPATSPWCPVRLSGTTAWVGPVLVPGRAPCAACLRARLQDTQPLRAPAADTLDPLVVAAAATLTVALARRWRAGRIGDGVAELWTLDPLAGPAPAPRVHRLVRRPGCPRCAPPPTGPAGPHPPVTLAGDGGVRPSGGLGWRTVDPTETARRLEALVSPLVGPVTRLSRNAPGAGLHVWTADDNPAVHAPGAVRRQLRSVSGGKGTTDGDARAGALAEALERLQGRAFGDEPGRVARGADLPGAVHPDAVQLFSEAQLGAPRTAAHAKDAVPAPFDPEAETVWSPAWSLTAGEPRWLPASICWYGRRDAAGRVADSNGCGAGNTPAEAILGGLLELVERDAVGIWWLNRLSRPAFALDAVEDPWLAGARAAFAARGRPVHVLDVTNDVAVPAAVAVSAPEDGPVLLGFGAHPDGRVAVRRAVAEAAQMLGAVPQLEAWRRAEVVVDDDPGTDPVTAAWARGASLADQPWLRPAPGPATVPRPAEPPADVAAAVRAVQARVEAVGCEVIVVDQTRPDIGLPTFRVAAPGLRHFWHRLAPGRLYDVPVALGWSATAPTEDGVNPFTMPM